MGTVKAVCTSEIKGIQKSETDFIVLRPNWGIEDDAHAGTWHRQVSLLSYEKIEDFKARGADVVNGSFGENIIVEGFDLKNLPIGTRFRVGSGAGEDADKGSAAGEGTSKVAGETANANADATANAAAGEGFAEGPAELELTQIGKECHAHCAIYHKMGDCIMPREGVFCKVIRGGRVAPGDPINIIETE